VRRLNGLADLELVSVMGGNEDPQADPRHFRPAINEGDRFHSGGAVYWFGRLDGDDLGFCQWDELDDWSAFIVRADEELD
jgi:hypothetical protein